jgi:hypothetical protein
VVKAPSHVARDVTTNFASRDLTQDNVHTRIPHTHPAYLDTETNIMAASQSAKETENTITLAEILSDLVSLRVCVRPRTSPFPHSS